MDRRHASKLVLSAGLAAPALIRPHHAVANPLERNAERARILELAPVEVQAAARRVVLEWIVMQTATGWLGMNITQPQRRYEENRVTFDGMLGELTRPTVRQRLENARMAGTLYIISNLLFVLPNRALDPRQLQYTLYHKYFSWDVEAALRVVDVGMQDPDEVRARGRAAVGVVYLMNPLLMLMVNPVQGRTYTTGSS